MYHLDMQIFEPTCEFRKDWNYQPDVSKFNPKEPDTDQWIKSAKAAGATYAVLVAKHCSGFSLWPTKAHEYSVKNSPWRNGQGEVIKDFIASCKKYGVKPGLYASASVNAFLKVNNSGRVLSGNAADQEKYKEVVKTQLTELWSQYGELFEIWFNGGVLPPDKGGIDMRTLLQKYQPNAADFPPHKNAFQGGWFWKEGQEDKIRTLTDLCTRYEVTVGRNTNMILGVVIDNRGLVPDADVKRLAEFGDIYKGIFREVRVLEKRAIAWKLVYVNSRNIP